MTGKIVILDGYSLMYRAYHALQTPMNAPDGTPTNAVHGFVMMLLKVVEDERPDALAVAFDLHAPTFRHRMYDAYKGTRKPMPDELRAQDPIIRELIGQMEIPILELEGYEADDIMGTVSRYCEEHDLDALLVTGDRDSFQLSGPRTTILYTKKGITDTVRVTPAYIEETYGLAPAQLIDVKSLMGDASDNIPGVPGVGEKTALRLVQQYGSLAAVLDRADAEQKGKLRERLLEHRDLAELSHALATIDRQIPLDVDPDAWKLGNLAAALPRLRELRMNAAARRLADVARACVPPELLAAHAADAPSEALPPVEALPDLAALSARIADIAGGAAWVSLCLGADFTLATDAARLSLPLGGDLLSPGVSEEDALAAARPLLEKDIPTFLWNLKALPMPLEDIRGEIVDVMLAAYALNPQRPGFDAESLCAQVVVEGFR